MQIVVRFAITTAIFDFIKRDSDDKANFESIRTSDLHRDPVQSAIGYRDNNISFCHLSWQIDINQATTRVVNS